MAAKTVTRSTEVEIEPSFVFQTLMDASLIPRWVPVFADSITNVKGNTWIVDKGGSRFQIEVVAEKASQTVDYLREFGEGTRAGAYIRVLSSPVGGSVIVMTLPIPTNQTIEQVSAVLSSELDSLVQLLTRLRTTS